MKDKIISYLKKDLIFKIKILATVILLPFVLIVLTNNYYVAYLIPAILVYRILKK